METLTKQYFEKYLDEQFGSLRAEMATEKELDSFRAETKREFSAVRKEMATKAQLDESVDKLATITLHSFEETNADIARIDRRLVGVEGTVLSLENKVDTLIGLDHQHQIDVLRDDMRVVKTKLGMA